MSDFAADVLRKEATACAKHLDEMEGLGYSANVMRLCVAELNRLYREHDEDIDRMERAAEVVENLNAEANKYAERLQLKPQESAALTVAISQVSRGEFPMPACATVCVVALARLTNRLPDSMKSLSGGNTGEPKACTPAEERGIAGATGAGQLPDGNAESTHDSANRRSPDGHTSSLSLDESNQQS